MKKKTCLIVYPPNYDYDYSRSLSYRTARKALNKALVLGPGAEIWRSTVIREKRMTSMELKPWKVIK